ncbi:Uncharacterised protein [Mycobacteroides abscessus subsp. abscessus]|nr:Uncharacterised protein [Mycobacteroides abscessus subsp. abscessus]
MRSAGWSGSIGTYAPPAFSTACMPITSSSERRMPRATSDSGPTPSAIRNRARRLTRSSNSA